MSKTNDGRDELIKDLVTQVNTMCDRLCEIAKALGVDAGDTMSPVELAGACAAAARKSRENKYGHDPLPQPRADHYEFTGETKEYKGETIYRIRSKIARPHHGVKAGDKGGWIGLNATLGECAWIAHDAVACDHASVIDAAKLRFHAAVSGYGRVRGDALVEGDALVSGNAVVEDEALVSDKARVCISARVSGSAVVTGYAVVKGEARVMEDAVVGGDARVMDNALLCGRTKLGNNVVVSGKSLVNAPITITDSIIRDARICAEPSRGGDNDE